MNPNDVRIGNFIRLQTRQINARLIGVMKGVMEGVFYFNHGAQLPGMPSSQCSGIQITERVLEQMDFSPKYVKEGYLGYGENPLNLFIIRKPTPEDEYYLWEYTEGGQDCVKYLYYVHDLQNLYFLMWGVELEFNDFQKDEQ